jgi:hypothetical protein
LKPPLPREAGSSPSAKRFRDKARHGGFDPNIWFGNVEHGAAATVGQETVQYVGNIHKYYVVYSTLLSK